MPDYVAFFLDGAASVVELETFEISHPSFSKVYRFVRNNALGLTATLETTETVDFEYYPARVTKPEESDDLGQAFNILLGDLGELIPEEIDRVRAADTFHIRPACVYRTFASNDLSAPLQGPFKLQLPEMTTSAEGAAFDARPETLNNTKTGEIYDLTRFPMLRALL